MQTNLLLGNISYECMGLVLAPLIGALLAGLLGKRFGRTFAHTVTIAGVLLSLLLSALLAKQLLIDKLHALPMDLTWYTWGKVGALSFQVGFYLDQLTILMLLVVSFVSLMVHIYTIGYMADDPGYQRFFSYIALFTFSMLMLVLSNNFLQLFFGWEAVGVASYLLIGFWFKRESAIFANLKAFLVNRVGDMGFLLGIAAVLAIFGTLDYGSVFAKVNEVSAHHSTIALWGEYSANAITVICILLFIGAMGKSAQVPLHVWLPDSMEGPTPISALIHAATMVTAGVFMVARMSPLFEYSDVALSVVLLIGATTCFLMGLLGIVQNDIKRIIAYSTLSQLGYMMTALGASAYGVGIFHLMTHAFFKALLFLGAGSVIIAMHHEQNIWKMGGLWRFMPITYFTMVIGTFAIIGFPFFSGFYSKDFIIEAVHASSIYGSHIAYYAVLGSVFVTALYSFRLLFVVFHTTPRMDNHTKSHLHESPIVVWLPLVLLAIPSAIIGFIFAPEVIGQYFSQSIVILPNHGAMAILKEEFHGALQMAQHGFLSKPFILAMSGLVVAWMCYVQFPKIPALVSKNLGFIYKALILKYGFDLFNEQVVARATRGLGWFCWRVGDKGIIDGVAIDGSAKTVRGLALVMRHLQSGYIYHYAFAMIAGLIALLVWLQLV